MLENISVLSKLDGDHSRVPVAAGHEFESRYCVGTRDDIELSPFGILVCFIHVNHLTIFFPIGDFHQAEVRADEEGVRAERAVRLRDPHHHLQLAQQALPVRVVRHGQGPAEVHGSVPSSSLSISVALLESYSYSYSAVWWLPKLHQMGCGCE